MGFLCRLFEDLVPTVLSMRNLKSMARKHAKVVPKEPLQRMLEFILNIDPKSRVPAFTDYPTMVHQLQLKYVSLGCRAQQLTLPFVFGEAQPKHCIYLVDVSDNKWFLQNKPAGTQRFLMNVQEGLMLYVQMCWSEQRAMVHDETLTIINEYCVKLLPGATAPVAPAIEDAPWTPPPKRRSIDASPAASVLSTSTTSSQQRDREFTGELEKLLEEGKLRKAIEAVEAHIGPEDEAGEEHETRGSSSAARSTATWTVSVVGGGTPCPIPSDSESGGDEGDYQPVLPA